jgi:hypothetical protein
MKRALLVACAFLMAASAAGARARCTPDKFWRVSLGACVSKRAQPQHYTVRFGAKRVKPAGDYFPLVLRFRPAAFFPEVKCHGHFRSGLRTGRCCFVFDCGLPERAYSTSVRAAARLPRS